MKNEFKEINKNEWIPVITFPFTRRIEKTIEKDGDIYTNTKIIELIFDSEKEFGNEEFTWHCNTYDFSQIGLPIYKIWDCDSFIGGIVSKINVNGRYNDMALHKLFNYSFYDYDNPIIEYQYFKTRPPKEIYNYNTIENTIFDKNILKEICCAYRSMINDVRKELICKNIIYIHTADNTCGIDFLYYLSLKNKQEIKLAYNYMYQDNEINYGGRYKIFENKIKNFTNELTPSQLNEVLLHLMESKIKFKSLTLK